MSAAFDVTVLEMPIDCIDNSNNGTTCSITASYLYVLCLPRRQGHQNQGGHRGHVSPLMGEEGTSLERGMASAWHLAK